MRSHTVHANCLAFYLLFFFNDTATTEIYTLSLHDALPIYPPRAARRRASAAVAWRLLLVVAMSRRDRKSTRLNSSHQIISYAVFCLKKKKRNKTPTTDE